MFLDPRYARLERQKNRSSAVGRGCLFTSLLNALFDSSNRVLFQAAESGLQCKLMQTVPISGEQ
jgi:hypothetical protein